MRPARIILLWWRLSPAASQPGLPRAAAAPSPRPQVVEVVQSPSTQVLVAKDADRRRRAAHRPTTSSGSTGRRARCAPDYVTIEAMPEAPTELAGAVARFEFFPGEPIREVKLVRADQGYLSAVLEKGKRGVSIRCRRVSASGGFIVPNDRVDIILTQDASGGQVSRTLLSNVKVLALGSAPWRSRRHRRPRPIPKTRAPNSSTAARSRRSSSTPAEAETLINATTRRLPVARPALGRRFQREHARSCRPPTRPSASSASAASRR